MASSKVMMIQKISLRSKVLDCSMKKNYNRFVRAIIHKVEPQQGDLYFLTSH